MKSKDRLSGEFFGGSSAKDVHGGARKLAALQRIRKRGFIDQLSARGVDHARTLFHLRDGRRVDQILRRGLSAVCNETKSLSASKISSGNQLHGHFACGRFADERSYASTRNVKGFRAHRDLAARFARGRSGRASCRALRSAAVDFSSDLRGSPCPGAAPASPMLEGGKVCSPRSRIPAGVLITRTPRLVALRRSDIIHTRRRRAHARIGRRAPATRRNFCGAARRSGRPRGYSARQVPAPGQGDPRRSLGKITAAGTEVRGKTLGLIGLGRIGSEGRGARGSLDMRVLAYDPFISEAAAREVSVELVHSKSCWRRAILFHCTPR